VNGEAIERLFGRSQTDIAPKNQCRQKDPSLAHAKEIREWPNSYAGQNEKLPEHPDNTGISEVPPATRLDSDFKHTVQRSA
jgi:hypothetical protein